MSGGHWIYHVYNWANKFFVCFSFVLSSLNRTSLTSCKGCPLHKFCWFSFLAPHHIEEHSWLEQFSSALKTLVKDNRRGRWLTRPGMASRGHSHLSSRTHTKQLARRNSDWPWRGQVTLADKYSNQRLTAYRRSWKMWTANRPPKTLWWRGLQLAHTETLLSYETVLGLNAK